MSRARTPRFPYAAALLCAACIGAAAWTWMRYSYAQQVSFEDLLVDGWADESTWKSPEGTLVSFRGRTHWIQQPARDGRCAVSVVSPSRASRAIEVSVPDFDMAQGYAKEDVYVGRVSYLSVVGEFGPRSFTSVDTTASRFTGASIAGLVVGAMGVFVFTLALRDWLNRRRYFRVQEAEGKT